MGAALCVYVCVCGVCVVWWTAQRGFIEAGNALPRTLRARGERLMEGRQFRSGPWCLGRRCFPHTRPQCGETAGMCGFCGVIASRRQIRESVLAVVVIEIRVMNIQYCMVLYFAVLFFDSSTIIDTKRKKELPSNPNPNIPE